LSAGRKALRLPPRLHLRAAGGCTGVGYRGSGCGPVYGPGRRDILPAKVAVPEQSHAAFAAWSAARPVVAQLLRRQCQV